MQPTHQSQPLGNIQPENKHTHHQLTIILTGNDGSTWSTEFHLDTKLEAPRRFLILAIQGKVQKPAGNMVQVSETKSEFTVQLRGSASPAVLRDLSATPLKDWIPTLLISFAESQAAIGILVNRGRVSVTLNEGE
jgi:hypothetical protein